MFANSLKYLYLELMRTVELSLIIQFNRDKLSHPMNDISVFAGMAAKGITYHES